MEIHPLGNNKVVKYHEDLKSAGLWTAIALYDGIFVRNECIGMIISIIATMSAIVFYSKFIMGKLKEEQATKELSSLR